MVVNLEDSIAVTKNLATKGCVRKVYEFFKRGEKEEQKLLDNGFVLGDDDIGGGLVSGLPDGVTSSQMCQAMKQYALEFGIDLDETPEDGDQPPLKKQRQNFWQSVDATSSFSMSNLYVLEDAD